MAYETMATKGLLRWSRPRIGLCRTEAELDAATLAKDITNLFGDEKKLAQMSQNARKLAMPNAARAIADYALALGDRKGRQLAQSFSGGRS